MLINKRFNNKKGVTIIELMIGIALSTLVVLGVTSFVVSAINHYSLSNNQNKLTEQLQIAMQLMTNEIHRAGYWSNASSDVGGGIANNNPFMSTLNGTDIKVPSSSCILFTYDANKTGTLPAISSTADDDRYGFTVMNKILQSRPRGAAFACPTSSTVWDNMTDPNVINITALTFTLNSTVITSGTNTLTQRNVVISITGQLVNNTSITKTLTQTVRVMNDRYN